MYELADEFISHLRATWRYRWYAIAFAWMVAIVGWTIVFIMPDRYEADARVYVDTQSVLRPLLAGLAVQPNIDQVVNMMSRTLISRPNVEKVIRMADMDIKILTPDDRENMIAQLTKNLSIKSAGRENLYTISYSSYKPQEAKQVVQSLLTIFVEGSLGDKRKDSDAARRFIDEQLKTYAEKLVSAEDRVTQFKRQHLGLMGGEEHNFYTRLQETKAALSQAELDLKEAENRRDAIKKQLSGNAEALPNLLDDHTDSTANPEIDSRIQALEQKLDILRLSYTEQHPDIIAAKRTIEQLKDQKVREAKLKKPAAKAQAAQNPVLQQLSVSLAESEADTASIKARVAEYHNRYNELKAGVDAVPQVEAEFTQLTRDYEVTKTNYEQLLSRRESAQISGDMESNTNVMDFRVIDPPQVPLKPNAPNRRLFMSMVLVAALGGGIGFAFMISQLRPTFNDERRLQEVSGVRVLGTVVMIPTKEQTAKRKKGLAVFLLSLLSLLSAYAAVMATLLLVTART